MYIFPKRSHIGITTVFWLSSAQGHLGFTGQAPPNLCLFRTVYSRHIQQTHWQREMQHKLAVVAAAVRTTTRGQLPFVSGPTCVQEVWLAPHEGGIAKLPF